MTLRHIPLEAINQSDLQRLIEHQVAEKRDIDYKRDTYGNRDQDYGEFLADVSSFANTAGGEIVIGMTEQAGVPTGFSPLQIDLAA
jgi:predicted HTH transcriptional regulator